jgi:hypothetical protein
MIMGYERPTFDMNREEGPLPPTELDRRYERPGKPCYMGILKIDTEPFISPREVIKRMRSYTEEQTMSKQMKEIDGAIECLRYLFGEKLNDQRPFMKEVANEILNKSPQRGIYTRLILGEDLAEKMARELLELAESKDPIVYAPIERLYRKYLLLKDEQIKKMDWSYTRIMT